MSAATAEIPVIFTGLERPGSVPPWARRDYNVQSAMIDDLVQTRDLEGISVLRTRSPRQVLRDREAYSPLFEKLAEDQGKHFRVVLGFDQTNKINPVEIADVLRIVPGAISGVEFALKKEELPSSLFEAISKLLATRTERDPLKEVQAIAELRRTLCAESGRLDARKIAQVFGITMAELARQIDVKKQTIGKTPDSEALQKLLQPYERIARLRAVLNDEGFRVWLNTPNEHLEDGDTPMEYLKLGARDQLAGFAFNMLTGAPS